MRRHSNDEESNEGDKSKITDVGFDDLLNDLPPIEKKEKSRPKEKFEAHD